MQLPPILIVVAHHLQRWYRQRDANRVVALPGGKSPHIQNPARGVANPITTASVR